MNKKITDISKKIEKPLEVLGLALLLTAAQIALYHIVMSDRFVNYYISLYQNVIVKIDFVYRGYIMLLTAIFGPSYTTVLYNFYEKIFILIFVINLIYIAITRYLGDRSESD
jgi:small basic protein